MTTSAGLFLYRGTREEISIATNTKASGNIDDILDPDQSSVLRNRPRDERRRATHNEVERRRRDKINSWIMKLGRIIPGICTGPGATEALSKAGILAGACEYIGKLREEKKSLDRHKVDVSALMEENTRLRGLLIRHGIPCDVEVESVIKAEES